ncbi:flagellar hook basal-body protein [Rhodopseudomonas sp. HC1]|uniref:flagellar hook basal-body protein n=1 Tax=Rhodopseudomonas infernalis TaxID=2897386 RepID=UPI001EE86538|nr:flagellar hook basal-body protein [Rhodopseudomonas infernalis]MCG6206226.1 flagellar hook basal-body protein [Rhodopseudomonas infernalis]
MGSLDALSTATSGLLAQSAALENVSGNVANAQTTAFKATDTAFDDLVSQSQVSETVLWRSVLTNGRAGVIVAGAADTDMAINGDGYFTVKAPTGVSASGQPTFGASNTVYSRRGDFTLDSGGYLVNGAGDCLMGQPIDPVTKATSAQVQLLQFDTTTEVPGLGILQSLSVSSSGRLQGTYSKGQTVDVASLPVATFRGQGFMSQGDGGTFAATPESGEAQYLGASTVVGNALEASNVDVQDQMITMVQAQQAYSVGSKVITTANEMMLTLTNLTI